ncbi:MAG: hypothetical protein NXI32_02940, partial [bacterium]|nr:hypothetical protein [bacterium]
EGRFFFPLVSMPISPENVKAYINSSASTWRCPASNPMFCRLCLRSLQFVIPVMKSLGLPPRQGLEDSAFQGRALERGLYQVPTSWFTTTWFTSNWLLGSACFTNWLLGSA